MYSAAAVVVLGLHLAFIAWVIFGAFFARTRLLVAVLHMLSLVWALLVEMFPWTCPLTVAENWLEQQAGVAPYRGGFLLHYLDLLVYPNVPSVVLTIAAALVVAANVVIYWKRWSRTARS
jgi:Protein of Unknown function (DUF2784)